MLVTNNTNQDYWFGPLHLPAGAGQQITVDDTSSTSLYLTNDQVADAINNLSQFGSSKITVVPTTGTLFPRPTGVPQLLHGDGSPEGLVYAPQGSLYMRRDVGSTGANGLYVKASGITSSQFWKVYTAADAVTGLVTLYDTGYISSAQPTIDTGANGFDTSFSHLLIKLIGRGDNASNSVNVLMNFNADTGANYDTQGVWGGQNVPTAVSLLGYAAAHPTTSIPANSASANYPGLVEIEIPFYSQPTANFYKMWTAKNVFMPNEEAGVVGGWWKSAGSAINRIQFSLSAGNFAAGSRLMVYAYN